MYSDIRGSLRSGDATSLASTTRWPAPCSSGVCARGQARERAATARGARANPGHRSARL
jgi:hypothetical protein